MALSASRGAASTRRSVHRVFVLGILALCASLTITVVVLAAMVGATWADVVSSYTLTNLSFTLGFVVSGAVIAWFRPSNAVGWIFIACGVGHLLTPVCGLGAIHGLDASWSVAVTRSLGTCSTAGWLVGVAGLFPLALLLFPDGRLPSRRWVPLAWLIVGYTVLQIVTWVLADEGPSPARSTRSILSIGLVLPEAVAIASGLIGLGVLVAAVASLVVRYVRGDETIRRQLLWVILAVVIMLVINSQRWLTGDGPILLLLTFGLVPAAIAIAIVRHRLLDIRLVLSRTLLYLLAIGALIAVYAVIVAALSAVVPPDADRAVSASAAVAVALGFNPLRLALQRVIDRAFYGTRSDPARTAGRVGEGLGNADDLGDVIERARIALRIPYLALSTVDGERQFASGELRGGEAAEIPLRYRGFDVGRLVAGLRRGERVLHDSDRLSLELIAAPLAVAVHASTLTEQVQASRSAVIEAREEERLRLQRELHDGLGPILTSAALQADATSNVLRTDPLAAERLLADVRSDIRQALNDVRRVVYGLRPIELAELGLIGALEQRTRQPIAIGDRTVRFSVEGSALRPLSPAVELAAFRIAMEGVSNVLRHSDATCCTITIDTSANNLELAVTDNGSPTAGWMAGVGLRSIVDRAEELGGTATGGPTPEGWRIRATVPSTAPQSVGR